MKSSRTLSVTAGVAAITLASLLVASPASAATLPSGQRITTTNNVNSIETYGTQVYEASPADASTTLVGSVQNFSIVEGVDVNEEGIGWAIQTEELFDPSGFLPVLRPFDANTGLVGPGVPVLPDDDFNINDCRGIDLMPTGTIVLACNLSSENGPTVSYLGTVSTGGAFHRLMTTVGDGLIDFRAVAFNAVTGRLWGFGLDSVDTPVSVLIDTSGATWDVEDRFIMDRRVESADFDRDGQLFVVYAFEDFNHLGTNVPGSDFLADIGAFTLSGDEIGMRTITVWGKEVLPATGPVEMLPIGLGTALLFLAGAAFIATNRIQRRATPE